VTGGRPQRIVVTTGEVLGTWRAGPATRAWHLAAALANDPIGHDVTLAARPGPGEVATPGFSTAPANAPALEALGRAADVVVAQGDLLSRFPALGQPGTVVVGDLYDPYQLEALEQTAGLDPDHQRRAIWAAGRAVDDLLRRGDLFLCAGGRQRDLWVGALATAGRVNEATHRASPDLSALLVDVPFGVDEDRPEHERAVLRDVVPGIGPDAVIFWWGGGIYDWLDPATLLNALAVVVVRHPEVQLVFAGARHPNPDVDVTRAAAEARARADRLGLTGRHVHFLDWVAYDERGSYLLESDVVVSTHLDHLETAYSYRTRLLDALWAERPIVTTGGDALGAMVAEHGAGLVTPPGDVEALARALTELVEDPARRAECGRAAGRLGCEQRWSRVVAPLLEFCRAPTPAPDRVDPLIGPMLRNPRSGPPRASLPVRVRRAARRLGPRPR
jgi:glycosyltransferase involved in cell wall biosynthesis